MKIRITARWLLVSVFLLFTDGSPLVRAQNATRVQVSSGSQVRELVIQHKAPGQLGNIPDTVSQATWVSRVTTTTNIRDQQIGGPGLQGLTQGSATGFRSFRLQVTTVDSPDLPAGIPPLALVGTKAITADYDPSDPYFWRMNGPLGILLASNGDPDSPFAYPLGPLWPTLRDHYQQAVLQWAGTLTESSAHWTENLTYRWTGPVYYTDDLPYTVTFDVMLSSPSTPTVIPGHTLVGQGQWSTDLPTASLLADSSASAEYSVIVPAGTTGTIRWLEIFTPAGDPANPVYTAHSWDINDTRSPVFSLSVPTSTGTTTIVPFTAELAVDANHDGQIKLASEDTSDATSADKPYRFWLNDDFDGYGDSRPPGSDAIPDFARDRTAGVADLKDYYPVVLDLKQLINALPPDSGVTYKLKQADGALKLVFTSLTRVTAFEYNQYPYAYSDAFTYQITAAGLPLNSAFLNSIKDGDQGVVLMEGTAATTQPLVLVVEKGGVTIAEVSLPLSIGPRILLLLHGMNSNTATWNAVVDNFSGGSASNSADIRNRVIQGPAPALNAHGVRCYRVQFGAFEDTATARTGLEGLRASNAQGGIDGISKDYLTEPTLKCGDFETFDELAQEVDEAITLLLIRHPNAQIVLVAHSRGGLAGRKFLEGNSSNRSAVVGFLVTSSLQLGSPMGRIYQWLDDHRRDAVLSFPADWHAVDFLKNPTSYLFFEKPSTLDVRRPVIMDMSDRSEAIGILNDPSQVANLPAKIMYGEIINSKVDLGVLTLGATSYSVFDGLIGKQVSADAAAYILGQGKSPADFPGDGLIPFGNQVFTQLPGFPAPGYPPAPDPATGQNTIPRLLVHDRDLVHTDAPLQYQDIRFQLQRLAREWFQ